VMTAHSVRSPDLPITIRLIKNNAALSGADQILCQAEALPLCIRFDVKATH